MGTAKSKATGKAKRLDGSGFKLPTKPASKPAVNEERAAAFVAAVEAPPPPPAPPPAAPAPPPAGASRLRRAERGERLAIYLPPELATALRVRCAHDHRSASDAVTEAVRAWLEA